MFKRIQGFTRPLLGLLYVSAMASGAGAADKVVIAHGSQQIELTHPGLYLGGPLGFAEEEGLDLQVQTTQGSQQALQLLAAGQADFAAITSTTVFDAREQGVAARIVYSEVSHYNAYVAALADGPYTDVASWKGTEVGVYSMSSGGDPFLAAVLKENGLSLDDVTMVPLGAGAAALEALNAGKVSSLSLWAGAFAVFDNLGADLKLFNSAALDTSPGFILATTDAYIAAHPDIVAKVGRIYAKAYVFASANPEATVQAYWKALPDNRPAEVTDQVVAEQKHILEVGLRDMLPDTRPDTRLGWNDASGIDIFQDYLIANGARTVKLPSADLYTNDFVDQFNDFDAAEVIALAESYTP